MATYNQPFIWREKTYNHDEAGILHVGKFVLPIVVLINLGAVLWIGQLGWTIPLDFATGSNGAWTVCVVIGLPLVVGAIVGVWMWLHWMWQTVRKANGFGGRS